jgi:glutathione S-transferase
MPQPILYGFAVSPHVRASRILFHEKNLVVDYKDISLGDLAEPWFAEINPFRKMPVLVDGDLKLYETPALLVYGNAIGAGRSLIPDTASDQALMWKFIGVAQNYLFPSGVMQLYFHNVLAGLFGMEADSSIAAQAVAPVALALDAVEDALAGGWLAGAEYSLADIYCGVMVDYVARTSDGRTLVAGCPNVEAWLEKLRARPSFETTFAPMLDGTDQL